MAFLASAAPYITAGVTALSVYQMAQQGKIQQAQMNVVAKQREKAANQAMVEAQGEAANERRKATYVRSRAQAMAGKSGFDLNSPDISKILTDIDVGGEMNALNALSSGKYLSGQLQSGASAARREGAAARSAGYVSAGTTALTDSVGFYEKYGDDFA